MVNVANKQELMDAAKLTVDTFNQLDIACANSGLWRLAPFEQISDEMCDFHIDVNINRA